MLQNELIARLQRLGYRSQVIGDKIVIIFQDRTTITGSREKIEQLLPSLSRDGRKPTPDIKRDKQKAEPTYGELLAKLRRLEAERDAYFGLGDKVKKRKKKKKKRKDAHDWDPNRWKTVSGGLPSLGKRR